MVLPDLPAQQLVIRAFEIAEFANTRHAYTVDLPIQTQHVIRHIVERAEPPWPPGSPEHQGRTRQSRSKSPVRHWPQGWAIDKAQYKRDLTNFEFNTLYILRYLQSTPTPSDISDQTENIPRDHIPQGMADGNAGEGSSSQPQAAPVASFTTDQWNAIVNLIRATPAATAAGSATSGSAAAGSANGTPQPPAAVVTPVDYSQRDWKAEEVGFFDTSLIDPDDAPIVTVGRHSFYRDVYAFVDRLKDLAKLRPPEKLRAILPECFRGEPQSWYSVELGDTEKDLLRMVPLDGWYEQLIKRFKTRTPKAWEMLQKEKYTLNNTRNHKHPRAYVQNILRYAKAAEVPTIQAQLTMA